jgi:acyl transferase domain-containing protein
MAAIVETLSRQDIDFKPLAVSQGGHSPLMTEVAGDLREAIQGIRFLEPAITMVSTVSGQVAKSSEISDVDYWVRHVIEPVNFMGAMRALDRRGRHVFIEIGPFATLTSLGKRCVPPGRHVWMPSMHPSDQDGRVILDAVASAYAAGQPISWPEFHRGWLGRKIELPGYSFDHKPYWLPVGPTARSSARPAARADADEAPADQAAVDGAFEVASLTTHDGGDRKATITELIREKVAAVLEYPDITDVPADVDFTELGMDSLLAVKLRRALSASLSISFPAPAVFDHPSPRRLAQFLDEQLEQLEKVG